MPKRTQTPPTLAGETPCQICDPRELRFSAREERAYRRGYTHGFFDGAELIIPTWLAAAHALTRYAMTVAWSWRFPYHSIEKRVEPPDPEKHQTWAAREGTDAFPRAKQLSTIGGGVLATDQVGGYDGPMSLLGDQLRRSLDWSRARGVTPYQIAQRTGLDQGQLSRFLNGGDMTASSLEQLANALGFEIVLKKKKAPSEAPVPRKDA